MRWTLTIPGQAVSWNAMYRIGIRTRPARGASLTSGSYRKIIKTKEAQAYEDTVTLLAKVAKPSGFVADGFIVIEYRIFLGKDIDCDNIFKAVHDGLAKALGVDDTWFLPRAMSKTAGLRPPERRIELTIYPAGESPSPEPAPSA